MKLARPQFVIAVTLSTAILGPAGCKKEETHFREVKRPHEKITDAELERFFSIVEQLPDEKVPALKVYRPLPRWNPRRTMPVDELLKEEQKMLERGWDVEWHAERLSRDRQLQRVLQRKRMTLQQFVGLTLAIGAAISRSRLRDEQNLNAHVSRGRKITARLLKDERTFARLSREERFTVHRNAGWLTRLDRASRLLEIPPENLVLVQKHDKRLKAIFPKEFLDNPLDGIADLLEEKGMPFEELEASGRDANLTWDPTRPDARIGIADPDPRFE